MILLDVMMPELDGFEVLRKRRGESTRVPVLFLTARDAGVVVSSVSDLRLKIDTSEPRLLQTLRGVGSSLRLPRT